MWDRRKKDEAFCIKIGKDYVSSLRCIDEGSTLACTAGDGTVTGVNMNTRRIVNKVSTKIETLIFLGSWIINR